MTNEKGQNSERRHQEINLSKANKCYNTADEELKNDDYMEKHEYKRIRKNGPSRNQRIKLYYTKNL